MVDTTIIGNLSFNQDLTDEQVNLFKNLADDFYASSTTLNLYGRPCPWKLTKDNSGLRYSLLNELPYCIDWLKHIITQFVIPSRLTLNGSLAFTVTWNDIVINDVAFIIVIDDEITASEFRHFDANRILINWLYNENKRLTRDLSKAQLELDYQPGGKGAVLAQEHFQSLCNI